MATENWIARCLVIEQPDITNKNIFCLYGKKPLIHNNTLKPTHRDDTNASPLTKNIRIMSSREQTVRKIQEWTKRHFMNSGLGDIAAILTEDFFETKPGDMPPSLQNQENYVLGANVSHKFIEAPIKSLDFFAVMTHVFLQSFAYQKVAGLNRQLLHMSKKVKALENRKEQLEKGGDAAAQSEIDKLISANTSLKKRVDELKKDKATLSGKNTGLEKELNKFRKEKPDISTLITMLNQSEKKHAVAIKLKERSLVAVIAISIGIIVLALVLLLIILPRRVKRYTNNAKEHMDRGLDAMFRNLEALNQKVSQHEKEIKKKKPAYEKKAELAKGQKDRIDNVNKACESKTKQATQWEAACKSILSEYHRQALPDCSTPQELLAWKEGLENRHGIWAWLHPVLSGEARACETMVSELRQKEEMHQYLDVLYIDRILKDYQHLLKKSFEDNERLYDDVFLCKELMRRCHIAFRAGALLQVYFSDNEDLKKLSSRLSLLCRTLHMVFAECGISIIEPVLLGVIPEGTEQTPLKCSLNKIREVREKVEEKAKETTNFVVDIEMYGATGNGRPAMMIVVPYTPSAWY
ncbi:MAG: hypothetical protein GY862_30150 [Gammaproteobacteria bacterium]|nr:hypothetical protein [Gammaproteobacteria bacterium]